MKRWPSVPAYNIGNKRNDKFDLNFISNAGNGV